tara:strand:+ start:384 stop:1157 length:774 start_codon:yes stop_codon:yes gene_type:complete
MGIPLAGIFLPALKAVGSAKLPLLLRTAGAVGGGLPSLLRGDLAGAALGSGLGALGTVGMGGLAGKGTTAASKAIFNQAAKAGLGSTTTAALQGAARAGIPLAGGLALGSLSGGIGGGAASGVAKGAAGLAGYGTVGGEGMGGSPLPPGMNQYGGVLPLGDPLSVLSPLGLDAGRRLRTVKDAEALRDATNIVLPTVRKFSEQAKRDEFARSMAGAGIRQNIATNAALTENMQRAGLNLGMTAAQQAGDALTQRYNY